MADPTVYRQLFENALDALFVHDEAGRFVDVNAMACARLGYTRQELLGMAVADIDAPEIAARCETEAELADKATRRLSELLSKAPIRMVVYGNRDRDRYGRLLRVVLVDGRSVGNLLIAEGLARPWEGRRRPWCTS